MQGLFRELVFLKQRSLIAKYSFYMAKESVCAICGSRFVVSVYNKKTCSLDCARKQNEIKRKQRYDRLKTEIKRRKCKECGKEFYATALFNRVFCSSGCQYEYYRKNRKGNKNPNFKNGKATYEKFGKRPQYTPMHFRACSKYKKEFKEKNGYLFCEHCGVNINGTAKFETHHLYFASRYPGHKELHNFKNLICLCVKCHNKFHNGNEGRELLKIYEKKRGLKKLFSQKI